MDAFILELAGKYSWIMVLLSVIAVMGTIVPMLLDIFKAIAKATTFTEKDNLLAARIEGSKTYKVCLKVFLFVKKLIGKK